MREGLRWIWVGVLSVGRFGIARNVCSAVLLMRGYLRVV